MKAFTTGYKCKAVTPIIVFVSIFYYFYDKAYCFSVFTATIQLVVNITCPSQPTSSRRQLFPCAQRWHETIINRAAHARI